MLKGETTVWKNGTSSAIGSKRCHASRAVFERIKKKRTFTVRFWYSVFYDVHRAVSRIFLDAVDAVHAAGFCDVAFRLCDDLAVRRFKAKTKFARFVDKISNLGLVIFA
jgi:hypothetical protein